jgi:hypothetical protein
LYVSKILTDYEIIFGSKPKPFATPMIEKDPPEIDTSDLIDALALATTIWSTSVVTHSRTF